MNSKMNKLLWRGVDTGLTNNDIRNKVVIKYQNTLNPDIDIKFKFLVFDRPPIYNLEHHMSYADMLQYKFLLSLEGNDVATNLKWILLSNSVVLMAKPTKCSWFMEDMLIPFVHYVPVCDDFSDVEEQFTWCLNNLDICEKISINATKYMEQFLDEENEKYITNEVIKNYFKYVNII